MWSALLTAWNVNGVVKNFTRELQFIRRKVAEVDYRNVSSYWIIMIPKGATLIKRDLPMEFHYMITTAFHVSPIILEALDYRVKPETLFGAVGPQYVLKIQKGDYVINLNDMILPRNSK